MAVISCERAWELLSQQLDEPLSPQEEQELEEHLASCPSCRRDKEELEQMKEALQDLEEVPAPADFTQRVMGQIQQETQHKPKVIPLWRRPPVRALAGLAACALLCIGLYRFMPQGGDLSAGMIRSSQGADSAQAPDSSASEAGTNSGREPAQEPEIQEPDQSPAAQPRTADLPPAGSGQDETRGGSQAQQPTPYAGVGGDGTEDGTGESEAQIPKVTTASTQTELVVSALSEQARALLPAQEDWSVDNKGNTSCTVSSQVLEQLCQVLDQEGTEYTVSPRPWSETCVVRLG